MAEKMSTDSRVLCENHWLLRCPRMALNSQRERAGRGCNKGHSVVNQQPKQQANTFNNLKGWRGSPRVGVVPREDLGRSV